MDQKILIVEDEKDISSILQELLTRNGCRVTAAYDGISASKLICDEQFDMILMDLMLPGKSGEELLTELRGRSAAPVIVISAKSMLETRLEVLRLGADDYILKPFDLNEVLVRIEVVLRRCGTLEQSAPSVIEHGGLRLFTEENRVTFNDSPVNLTAKELQLLRLFMEHPSKVFTKANLYESVWNEDYVYEDNTINVHVSNLRSKLKKASGTDFIETVWGIGYKLKEA